MTTDETTTIEGQGMSLADFINRGVAAKLDTAFTQKAIDARVDKLVEQAIDDALRSYSKTGEMIKKAVEKALRVDRLDLPSYGQVVLAILKTQIEAIVAPLAAGKLAEDMEALLKLAPQEIKLSEIAGHMLEEKHDAYGEAITVIVEHTDYDWVNVYLDEEQVHENRDKYRCRHHLAIGKDGKLISLKVDGRDFKDTQHFGRAWGVGQRLRAYYACGTRIIVDEQEVCTSVGVD